MFCSEESMPATGPVKKSGFAWALCAAGLTLAATAGVASAQQEVTGPYETNGVVVGTPPDAFTLTHDPVAAPAGSSVEFTPSSPVTLDQLGSLSFGYTILGGQTGGGVPRIFFSTSAGNLILRPDFDPAFGDAAGDTGTFEYNFAADGDEPLFETGSYNSLVGTFGDLPITRIGLVHDFNSLSIAYTDYTITTVPEPTALGLLGLGSLALLRRRRGNA